jgi:hypothetical protein
MSDGTNNVTAEITLTYDAIVVGSSNLISDVHLMGSDARNPPNSQNPPEISIGESVYDLNTLNFLGALQIQDPPQNLGASLTFCQTCATTGIFVQKDILLESGAGTFGGAADYANLTTMSQLLSQTPEPRAYAFLLVGFFGIFVAINRRRRQTA